MCVNLPWGLYLGLAKKRGEGHTPGEQGKTASKGNKGQRTLTNTNALAQSQSLCIPTLAHADPIALQKSSLLPERPCAERLRPSSHSPLHTPPTLVQLKAGNFQVRNVIPEFHSTF